MFSLKNNSIKGRLMITNIFLVLIPFTLIFLLLFIILISSNKKELNRLKLSSLEQQGLKIDRMYDEVLTISNTIYLNPNINRYISSRKYSDEYSYITLNNEISVSMMNVANAYPNESYCVNILAVNGYNFYQKYAVYQQINAHFNDIQNESWYKNLDELNGEIIYISSYQSKCLSEEFKDTAVFAARRMNNLNTGRNIGVMLVNIRDVDIINKIKSIDNTSQIMVMDNNGKVIAASDKKMKGVDLSQSPYYNKLSENKKGFFPTTINGEKFQLTFTENIKTKWKIISYEPKSYTLSAFILVFIAVSLIILMLTIIMARYNSNYIAKKVNKINAKIKQVSTGDLDTRINEYYGDEFKSICNDFNFMLDKIKLLMSEIEKSEQNKRKLELDALQAQINPHFLYNTIASIRFMVQMEEYSQADEAMIALVKLLRRSFSDNRNIVPISSEIEMIKQYISIMKFRYQNSFEYKIEMEHGLEDCGIIKQAIQPIVENSISHGFNKKDGIGHILIQITSVNDDIKIFVCDDGVDADINKINEKINLQEKYLLNEQFSGIGLQNIQQRIKKTFGEKYGIYAHKNSDGGITFCIHIPKIQTSIAT